MNKLISIIVPAFNEEDLIRKTLLSLKNQDYWPIEIIVVDNGSADRTGEIAKKYADRVLYLSARGASRARNFGAKESQGEYLMFLDADSVISKNSVRAAVQSLDEGYAGGIFKINYGSTNPRIKLVEIIQNFYFGQGKPFYAHSIYTTKKIFNKIKGWDENIEFGEDVDILKKISKLGELKYNSKEEIKTSPRRFIKNRDYFYAIVGGALALYGVKNLPFYPIRNTKEKRTGKKNILKKLFEIPL